MLPLWFPDDLFRVLGDPEGLINAAKKYRNTSSASGDVRDSPAVRQWQGDEGQIVQLFQEHYPRFYQPAVESFAEVAAALEEFAKVLGPEKTRMQQLNFEAKPHYSAAKAAQDDLFWFLMAPAPLPLPGVPGRKEWEDQLTQLNKTATGTEAVYRADEDKAKAIHTTVDEADKRCGQRISQATGDPRFRLAGPNFGSPSNPERGDDTSSQGPNVLAVADALVGPLLDWYLKNCHPGGKKPSDYENDSFGRQLLANYLLGGPNIDIDNDPAWSDYMRRNQLLRNGSPNQGPDDPGTPGMQQRNEEQARAALNRYLQTGQTQSDFSNQYHQEIENGEQMVGYHYLHGTNANAGDFKHNGNTTVKDRGDGTYEVKIDSNYQWNDKIDPNPKYSTDVEKSSDAEKNTHGQADGYDVHIRWSDSATVIVDKNGKVRSAKGYPW